MRSLEELIQARREEMTLPLTSIRIDGGTQYRDAIDRIAVEDYVEAISRGDEFPPIETVWDGEHHWLVDGFHRYHAYLKGKRNEISVRYLNGTLDEAKFLAFAANTKHGLQRNIASKRKVVLLALEHPELRSMSNYQLSGVLGVSAPFIRSLRDQGAKARQQEARDRSALRKLEEKVANPIPSDDEIDIPEDVGPSDVEIEAAEAAMAANEETWMKLLESDNRLAEAFEEIKRVNLRNAQLESRMRGIMNEKAQAVRVIRELEGQIKRMSKALHASKSKTEIRLDHQIRAHHEREALDSGFTRS
jgi:hypothetical protein